MALICSAVGTVAGKDDSQVALLISRPAEDDRHQAVTDTPLFESAASGLMN